MRTLMLILACTATGALAQVSKPLRPVNLPDYYNSRIHFGFSLMLNRSILIPDQGTVITNYRYLPSGGPGFGIGVNTEYMFHPHFTLRFVPDLAFEERSLDYQAVGSASYPIVRQRIASTLIDLPLNIKAMTTRFNNFALYMVSGGRYSTFLTRGTPAASPALKRYDIAAEAGMGIDLFMIYFKCAVELKFIKGLSDMTIYNGGPSTSLRSVKSQCLVLSLNFEG